MGTVGVVGLGLIGGSVGLAARAAGHEVVGFDVSETAAEAARARFCVDRVAPLEEVARADVVFLATPPESVVEAAEAVFGAAPPETIVTDCASVKTEIAAWAEATGRSHFVGGHPMAGHEKSGAAFATAWMFRDACWLLTPTATTKDGAIELVDALVREFGARPVRIPPPAHDRHVAILSHLPHVLAAVLLRFGEELPHSDLGGGSWRDLTRVGGVDPGLWTQILLGNRHELSKVLRETGAELASLAEALERNDRARIAGYLEERRSQKARPSDAGPRRARRRR